MPGAGLLSVRPFVGLPSRRLYAEAREMFLTQARALCPRSNSKQKHSHLFADRGIMAGVAALKSGSTLGPYEILAPIGSGGMGEAYRARDIIPSTFRQTASAS